jgi:NADP-dependent 3-hydroxy acid dehydrogenase YdfG
MLPLAAYTPLLHQIIKQSTMKNQVKTSSLQGKHIVILGASSGIGLATAKAAAHECA